MLLVSQRVEAPRMEPHLSLQGSIKRTLESNSSPAGNDKINELSDGAFPAEVKRICLDDVSLPMGRSDASRVLCSDVQNSPLAIGHRSLGLQTPASMGPSLGCVTAGRSSGLLGSSQVNGSDISSQFPVAPNAEMKQNAVDGHNMFSFDSKGGTNIQTMDQDLEDLLEELTNMPNELDILNNRSDPLNLGLVQTSQSSSQKPSPQAGSHLDNPLPSREFSPNYSQAPVGSPQRRPPSAGTSYPLPVPANSMPLPMSSPSQNQAPSQTQPPLLSGANANRTGPNWRELSHAQQLKKIAASQQQRSVSQVPHPQPGQAANWHPSSGPSPPYRPDKLPSPSLHQQPFSPPNAMLPNIAASNNPASTIQSYLYNKASSNQSTRSNMLVQQQPGLSQGPVNDNSLASEQLSFSNTKPLSHFDPDPSVQKLPTVAGGQGQPSVVHYMQQAASAAQQSPQPGPTQQATSLHFQQMRHVSEQKLRMQQLRVQRSLQHPGLTPQNRPDHNPNMVSRLPDPSANPNSNSGSGYIKNPSHAFLKQQLLKKQQNLLQQQMMADQEKQRQHDQMNGHMLRVSPDYKEPRCTFGVQQLNQYQAVAQSLPANSGQPLATSASAHCGMRLNQALLQVTSQNNLGPGIPSVNASQGDRTMGMYSNNPGSQQGMYVPSSSINVTSSGINMPLRPSQSALGMRSNSQAVPSQPMIPQRTTISVFGGSVANPAVSVQHIRQSISQAGANMSVQGITNPLATPGMTSQMWAQQRISVMQNQNKMDGSMQQFPNSPLFSKQNMRPNLSVQQFPHQSIAPPNQIAPGGQMRPLQQLNPGQNGQPMVPMSGQPPRNNQPRLPLTALASMKPVPPGITSLSQTHPAPGLAPASYTSTGLSSGSYNCVNSAPEVSSFDFLQHNNSGTLSGSRNESDFIESIMKTSSSNDDWINDLTLDDFLGQHS
ncbi:mastermind-like protein 2 [Callorhinchus milii]|uniref:mastermind-like protein 2 n=1 Tax=Callorhinchus milii TaxID=7868 RepID=UPI001C3F8189|nr:mastermind-like protein 2 [Callorhinchus milii]